MSLKTRYREAIQPKLLKDLNLSNIHEVPKVVKVTINSTATVVVGGLAYGLVKSAIFVLMNAF